jgi:hypothetical protein
MADKKPTHLAYAVRNYEKTKDAGVIEDASQWNKIGAVFAHQDGKGFDVVLDALPVDGRVVLRLNEPKSAKS